MKFGIPFHPNPSIWDQSAIFMKEVVENNYFIDGNERIGILVAILFLNFNNYSFKPPKGEIFSFTMSVAQVDAPFDEISKWFQLYTKKRNFF